MTNAGSSKLSVSGAVTVSALKNCDTIDTDANGTLVCGSDAGGTAGLSLVNADARYVKKQGDVMTGGLLISVNGGIIDSGLLFQVKGAAVFEGNTAIGGVLSAASLKVTSLANCDTIDTDANGNLTCGTDAVGGAGSTFGSGNVITLTSARYVDGAATP